MKKIIVVVFLLIGTLTYSQEIVPVTFGPMASMTSTSLTATPDFKDQIAGSGYNIGGFVRVKLLFLYAQAEASFGSKSSSITTSIDTLNSNVTFKLNGLDLSLIAGIKLFTLGNIGNFRVFVGYNLNNYSDITYTVDGNVNAAKNVNSTNNSILGGIGIDLSRFTFDLRYLKGLSDISANPDLDVKSNIVSITVGFKII